MMRELIALVGFGLVSGWALGVAAEEAETPTGSTPRGERPFHILKGLPGDPDSYHSPAAEIVRAGIPEKYGQEEWATVVLTHEVHQHEGIFTTLGAKMGVRARELLDAPTRVVQVNVETGVEQPWSCAIDGLQVALGSTLGQKLIVAPETDRPVVAATFEYEGRKVRLALRPEYRDKVAAIIQRASDRYGFRSPAYFEEIEKECYRVWAEFDRAQIFEHKFETESTQ